MAYEINVMATMQIGVPSVAYVLPHWPNAANEYRNSGGYLRTEIVDGGKLAAVARAFEIAPSVVACGKLVARPRGI